jgi:hypothetical protein
MLTFISVILLIIFVFAFLTLGYFDVQITDNTTLLAALNSLGITSDELQVLLGVAILFCQLAIILFSMLDRIGFAILSIVRPLIRLIPLIAFLTTVWKTYSPIVFNLLPERFAEVFGVNTTEGYLSQSISDGTFMLGVILTIVTMLFFILVNFAVRPGDTAQVRQLKAENAKLRKQVRSL